MMAPRFVKVPVQLLVPRRIRAATSSPHPAPLDALRRLRHLRRSLNDWRTAGFVGHQPQPQDFGLRLPPLRPSEVLWRMEARP